MAPVETIPAAAVTKQFQLFSVDNNTGLGINDGAEWRYPAWTYMTSLDVVVPLVTYIVLWYSVNLVVTAHCWTTWQEGIRRKRLINLTTSLIHSTVSSVLLLVFFFRNTRLMFESPLHFYDYLNSQVILLSVGYFIYDGFDMVINDKISIVTGVLLVHHTASIFVFSAAIASKKFLLYAFWALLMEVNSIFLHARSILHQSKLSTTSCIALTNIVRYCNLGTFVIFRFGVQFWLTGWAWVNRNNMHIFYMYIAFGGGCLFLLINLGIFLRILHSDGFLLSSVVQREKLDSLLEDNDFDVDVQTREKKELLM